MQRVEEAVINIIYLLSQSPEPLSLYRIARVTGYSTSTVRCVLDKLESLGHIVKVDGKYTVSPKYVYVYNGIVIYRCHEDYYLAISYNVFDECGGDPDCISKRFRELLEHVPASVKLWITMASPGSDDFVERVVKYVQSFYS